MRLAVVTLRDALERHIANLRRLVVASQELQTAIVGLELSGEEHLVPMATATDTVREAGEALEASQDAVGWCITAACDLTGVERTTSLRVLVADLPEAEAEVIGEQLSCVRSLCDALTELQRMNLVHAARGRQILGTFATLVLGDAEDVAPTYTGHGRARAAGRGPTLSVSA